MIPKSKQLKKKKGLFLTHLAIVYILEGLAAALLHAICILGPRVMEQLLSGALRVVLATREGRSFCLRGTVSSVHISLVKASCVAKLEVIEARECTPPLRGGSV